MKKIAFLIAMILPVWSFSAVLPNVFLTASGQLKLGANITMEWRHDPAWRGILLKGGNLITEHSKTTLSGIAQLPGDRTVAVDYTLEQQDENHWQYAACLKGDGDTKHISAEIKIPADYPADLEVGGKLFRLSGKKTTGRILPWSPAQRDNSFRISSGNESYTLRGEFSVTIDDLRFSGENLYCIHLHPLEAMQEKSFQLKVTIQREPAKFVPVNIAGVVNMGFRDPQANDGVGGWTDQGPDNDLSCLTEFGPKEFSSVDFTLIDPVRNNDKSCMVISGIRSFPAVGPIVFDPPSAHRYLYLLHAAAWVPQTGTAIGTIATEYTDGTKAEITVIAGKDCGNWWQPVYAFENGAIGWTGDNRSSSVGLYVSAFRLQDKPLKSIRFLPGKSVWMIAGVSFGNLRPQRNAAKVVTITAGKQWQPISLPLHFVKGSAMDFSDFNRLNPVKDGRLVIDRDGHFVPEKRPGMRLRMYGTNIGQNMTIPSHEESDILAERFAMEGYNTVRLHQFENRLYDWGKSCTLDFKAENLDRFHYLYARLRARGMYITTDVHSTRIVRPGDGIVECSTSDNEYIRKALTMFSDTGMQNWKDFARKIFKMPNPYTGTCMADDPALFAVNLDNEASIYHNWESSPTLLPLIQQRYSDYLRTKGIYSPELAKKRGREFYDFLKDRQFKVQREQMRFLKEELGVKAYITNLNNEAILALQPFRNELDLVDAHIYHDHPSYPLNNWNVPISNTQASAVNTGSGAMTANMALRIPGKPFMVTELQFCYPNRFRSEIAAQAGAYGALQDWDAIYRFAAGHSAKAIKEPQKSGTFDHYYDPLGILTGRIIHFLFVRGDVAVAKEPIIAFGWDDPSFLDMFDPEFRALGLLGRIGSAPQQAKLPDTLIITGRDWRAQLPAAIRQAYDLYRTTGVAVSLTGEIRLEKQKFSVSVVTPKSELFTFPGGNVKGKFMEITDSLDFSTISVHARDNQPLASSRDLLVFQLTDTLNNNTRFQTAERRLILDAGTLPVLAYRGRSVLSLNVDPAVKAWTVQALALDGTVLGQIPATKNNGVLRFTAEVFSPVGVTMIYRITPQQ